MSVSKKTILVIAPNPWSAQELARLQDNYNFIYLEDQFQKEKISWLDKLRLIRGLRFQKYVNRAISMAQNFQVDAILGADEFISCLYASAASQKLGLKSASLQLELTFQHKYHSRQLQKQCVPEAVPNFGILKIKAPPKFPIFVKPNRGSASLMAKRLDSIMDLEKFLKIPFLKKLIYLRMLSTFETLAKNLANLPSTGSPLIYEELLEGDQFTLEGYFHNGQNHFLGVVDSVMYPHSKVSFARFDFPSKLPEEVQDRMKQLALKLMQGAGWTFGFYNIEFFYNPKNDAVKIIEVNPRIAFQFTDLYEKVLGFNTFALWLRLLTDSDTTDLIAKKGQFSMASSCVLRTFQDAFVHRAPSPQEISKVETELQVRIQKMALSGTRLSSDIFQDVESYRLMTVNIGGNSEAEIQGTFHKVQELLKFELHTDIS